MLDFAAARRMMVDGQVRTADVTDRRLLGAMLELPRERFFPEDKASLAYLDLDANVSEPGRAARHLLKPMVLAKLIQAAEVGEGDRVLDLGCASGYSTAVLARLAAHVVGLEQDEALVRQASLALSGLGIGNAKVVAGPLDRGWPAAGPYDAIVLQGATENVPSALLSQLKDGGRLVCVLGRGAGAKAMLYRRIEGELSGRPIFDAAAPLLPGFARVPAFVF
ncbi:MAG: protein-L-isoaspartate O-methyltransferase [Alphaproteobacteria bacterium]|nr:protein-L-isoaspartate O-methyltransferase [Alphaproteobacteria bacterium]